MQILHYLEVLLDFLANKFFIIKFLRYSFISSILFYNTQSKAVIFFQKVNQLHPTI